MCGIMGHVGGHQGGNSRREPTVPILLKGLKRLEYRGYDSAGVAYFTGRGIDILKSEGKIANVEKLLGTVNATDSYCGIGHTRWATHGKPTTQNAHPHRTGHVVIVHNGIIENYQQIKKEILQKGYQPQSETDSELLGFLILDFMNQGASLVEATRKSFLGIEGACSVVVISEKEPGIVVGVRNGSPLVAAFSPQHGGFLASDVQPIIEYTRDVSFLETGDLVIVRSTGLEFLNLSTGKKIERPTVRIDWGAERLDKQGFEHYMLKEIYEQPTAWVDTLNGILDRSRTDPFPFADQPGVGLLRKANQLVMVACGTSYHAALLGKYWIERWSGIPVDVELASEFRYRDPVLKRDSLVIALSQSGETADTLSVIREMRKRGIPTLGITNVRGSTLSRETEACFYTSAGPEIGVAATKTFTSQLLVLFLMAGYLGLQRGRDSHLKIPPLFDRFLKLPHEVSLALSRESEWSEKIRSVAKSLSQAKGFFFIGRGYSFPIALEGALKLKEIAYIHAEGYAGGELKHGPIAMIDNNMVVVVLAPQDVWREKSISNLQEVKARGARILGIGCSGDQDLSHLCDDWIPLQTGNLEESLFPFHLATVVQLLAYYIAVFRGTDIDQPRNLAKSVTVE